MMQLWLRRIRRSWIASRASAPVPNQLSRAVREIGGSASFNWGGSADHAARSSQPYLGSFDRRLPPSIHVSERDRTRNAMPIPVAERCIEDWQS